MARAHGTRGARTHGVLRPTMMQNSYIIIKSKMTYNSRVIAAENARMMRNLQVFKTENANVTVKSNVHVRHRETKCS